MKIGKYKLNKCLDSVTNVPLVKPDSLFSSFWAARSKNENTTYKHTKNEEAAVWKLVYSNGKIIRNAAVLALPTHPNLQIPPN